MHVQTCTHLSAPVALVSLQNDDVITLSLLASATRNQTGQHVCKRSHAGLIRSELMMRSFMTPRVVYSYYALFQAVLQDVFLYA